jgi:DNA helicase-2/ATP-dependent DNA helicase PcrA
MPKKKTAKTNKSAKKTSKSQATKPASFGSLNQEQQQAVEHSGGPLLVIAGRFKDRAEMLTDLTLDPPNSTDELPGNQSKGKKTDDYLTLSTIHSAKGLEWEAVYVIHASDGFIPSDEATDTEGIEEELRLFYVALTRAKNHLYICSPRYFSNRFNSWSDDDGYREVSRFIDTKVKKTLQEV